jgi:hypothetical protein
MNVNESRSIEVNPRDEFAPSGIEITPGAKYQFKAEGKWKDSLIECGPKGWPSFFLASWNRLPGKRIFALCASVGNDEKNLSKKAFYVGEGCVWTAPPDSIGLFNRQLYFFANDWPGKYCNNETLPPEKGGPLRVTITRLL